MQASQTPQLILEAKDYIGTDYEKVPYLYSTLDSLADNNPNIKLWIERDKTGQIISVSLLYHTCLHFYSHQDIYSGTLFREIIANNRVDVIMLQATRTDLLKQFNHEQWDFVTDYIIRHETRMFNPNFQSYEVQDASEIPEIADLLLSEPIYAEIYTRPQLTEQLYDRWKSGFGKIFRMRIDNQTAGCVAVTGENDRFIFDGCLAVGASYRRKGIAEILMKAVISYACSKGKNCLCFIGVENHASLAMHKKFEQPAIIGKITKCIRKT